jgi:hypothetical protein
MKDVRFFVGIALIASLATVSAYGQGRGGGRGRGGPPPPPLTAQAGAAFDMTGYWVSVVTEDWRFRMVTPPKGDYLGVPLNAEGKKAADGWDPAADEAAGQQCRSYGAANIMRVPERLHITWQDDQTLKMETDAGSQTRVFYFGAPQGQGGDWQGISKASWELDSGFGARGEAFDARFGEQGKLVGGSLKVVTIKLKPGYLRKNGIPYSANAGVTEYYDRVTTRNGDIYLVVTNTVEDPMYLTQPYLTSTSFRKQADASDWNPGPCTAR